MSTITNIDRTTNGLAWRYTATASGGVDYWLDGVLIAENNTDGYYDYLTQDAVPPPVEAVDYGARPTNAWAGRQMQVQWFADGYTAYAVQEWRAGVVYSTRYLDVATPHRYVTVTVSLSSTASVSQTWTVRPAVRHDNGQYSIAGAVLTAVTQRYYLPRPPVPAWSWNGTTRAVNIT